MSCSSFTPHYRPCNVSTTRQVFHQPDADQNSSFVLLSSRWCVCVVCVLAYCRSSPSRKSHWIRRSAPAQRCQIQICHHSLTSCVPLSSCSLMPSLCMCVVRHQVVIECVVSLLSGVVGCVLWSGSMSRSLSAPTHHLRSLDSVHSQPDFRSFNHRAHAFNTVTQRQHLAHQQETVTSVGG